MRRHHPLRRRLLRGLLLRGLLLRGLLLRGLLLGGALLGLAGPAWADDAPAGLKLEHLVRVTGGAKADARLPLVVAMHGLGDRPEAFVGLFRGYRGQVRLVVPRAPRPYGRGFSWFRIQRPAGAEMTGDMTRSAAAVAALATRLAQRYPTRGKPIVTGFSQGGMLSYLLAVRHAGAISAAVPIAGRLPEALWPKSGPVAPVRALHGVADTRVPYAAAEALVVRLVDLGADARLTPFIGVEHRIPPPVRAALFAALDGLIKPPR